MTDLTLPRTRARAAGWRLPATLGIAFRDLRAGLAGFGIFLACLALGVTAITGIGSLASSLMDGLRREGRVILGGDLAFSLIHREANDAEMAALRGEGPVAVQASMRAMARTGDGRTALVDLKAVDGRYPVVGRLVTEPAAPLAELLAIRDGIPGVIVENELFARLDLKPGDRVRLGEQTVELRAKLVSEPDKVSGGVGFGPRLILSQEALRTTGLLQPGALVRWSYAIALPLGSRDPDLAAAEARVKAATPEAGWRIRSRIEASPEIGRGVGRFTQFLAVVALTALVVGGVGVANAVRAFIDRRRPTLAILKAVGATGGRVFAICFAEVMALAALGVAIGLVAGAALPFLIAWLFGALLPLPLEPSVHVGDLALGALYGFATAVAFALWPLGRAHDVPVSALFRDEVDPGATRPRKRYLVALALAIALLVAVAIGFAWERWVAGITVAATAGCFVLLRGVASGIMALAARAPRPRRVEWRMAVANLHRPGSLTPSLVLSLGLGVALLVALVAIDGTIRRELVRSVPERAPSFFLMDIPNARAAEFDSFVADRAAGAKLQREPMMRGRLVSLNGVPVEQIKAPDRFAWVLEGDRGITYSAVPPENSTVVDGAWWSADHTGERLVSFDVEAANALGLKVGDRLVANVLGRNLEARIANLRRIEWRSFGINFVMVFSPNTFAGAPHTHLATLTWPKGTGGDAAEFAVLRALGETWPMVTAVRVKDRLEAFGAVLGQLVAAIRGASAVALVSSLLVLAGALAAGHRARLYDAVILKTLGATRPRLIATFAAEYALIGAATALFGVIAGGLAAWAIVELVMRMPFTFYLPEAGFIALLAISVTIFLGLLGTWRILGEKVAPRLRNL